MRSAGNAAKNADSAAKITLTKNKEKGGSSKKGSGQFKVDPFMNEYDLPNIEHIKKAKQSRKGTRLRKRESSKESGSTLRDRTNSRTRNVLEETGSDYSSELRTPNLDFFKLLTAKRDLPKEPKNIKTAKKQPKRKRSKSKEGNVSQPQKNIFKKPKKSLPFLAYIVEPKDNEGIKKKKVSKPKKVNSGAISATKQRSTSNVKSRPSSLPRSAQKSRDGSLKSRKSSKKKTAERKKEEYFVGFNKSVLKKKENSIAMAKGSFFSLESAKKIQKAWKNLHDKKERLMKEVRMEPTKMIDPKEDSYEIEPICIKNETAVTPEPFPDQPLLKETSGSLILLVYSQSQLKTSSDVVVNSESDLETQFKKFMDNQEKNFKKFTKIVDKIANKSKNQSSLYRKCQEFKKRGELSIKFLKEKDENQEHIQTQRRLPINAQIASQAIPPPPASKRSSKSSITYCESPKNEKLISAESKDQRDKEVVPQTVNFSKKSPKLIDEKVKVDVSNFECVSVIGNIKTEESIKVESEVIQKRSDSNKTSNSGSVRSSSNHTARYTERWKEPTIQIPSPAQVVFKQFEYTNIDRKLKNMQNPFRKPHDLVLNTDLLEKSLEEKLTSLLPQIQIPNSPGMVQATPASPKLADQVMSPSINIRHLSQGTHLLSSEIEDTNCLRESLNSQILIKDEIVSRFREDDEEPSTEKPTKKGGEKLDNSGHSSNNSPSKDQDSSELLRLNSPHPEGALVNISPLPFQPPPKRTVLEKPAVEAEVPEPEEAKNGEVLIDFASLTNEDKSYAIADFILENLILEVFTSSIQIKERLIEAHRKISNFKSVQQLNEMSRYLSQIFTLINESPEEQLDIFMKLNLPIVHSDIKRLLLASPLLDPSDQMEMSILPYESVLNIHLYIKLEEDLRDTEYLSMGLSPQEIERSHIFHKLIFDSLNEKLDYERIGGLKPILPTFFFSYKPEPKITPDQCAVILERSKKDVIEWSVERIGLLPENVRRDPVFDEFSEENIESLREDALQKHLNSHIISLEEKWQDYGDEYLEVFLNLSDFIFDNLIEGVVTSLVSIKESRNRNFV